MNIAIFTALALSNPARALAPAPSAVAAPTEDTASVAAAADPTRSAELALVEGSASARLRHRITASGAAFASIGGNPWAEARTVRVEAGLDGNIVDVNDGHLGVGTRVSYETTLGARPTAAVTLAAPVVIRTALRERGTLGFGCGPSVTWQTAGSPAALADLSQGILFEGRGMELVGGRIGLSSEITVGFAF